MIIFIIYVSGKEFLPFSTIFDEIQPNRYKNLHKQKAQLNESKQTRVKFIWV